MHIEFIPMIQRRFACWKRRGWAVLCWLGAAPLNAAETSEDIAYFEKHVRPLFAEHCYQCHSAQAEKVKGGLLLDSRMGWEKGGESGEAVVPGEPGESRLLRAVGYGDPDLQMPPKYQLPGNAVAKLRRWIAMGAPDPREGDAEFAGLRYDPEAARAFWAFKPPRWAEIPVVRDQSWARDPLDQFILSALEAQDLQPVRDADRVKLVRRVFFDLTGLPPAPEEIATFAGDPRSDDEALSAMVDRLLASEQFGERWGRHWLDVVRFAESMGRTRNIPFPFAWRYRDYVIDAFNGDKAYDRFLTEQIAGDLLPASSPLARREALVATGLLALGSLDLNEGNREQFLMDRVDEQIDTVTRTFTALTVSCARCHDHKFDPVPTEDYYAMAGIFRSTDLLGGYLSRRGANGRDYYDPSLLVSLPGGAAVPDGAAETSRSLEERRSEIGRQLQRMRTRQQRLNRMIRAASRGGDLQAQQASGAARNRNGRGDGASRPANPRVELRNLRQKQRALEAETEEIRALQTALLGDVAMGVWEADRMENCRVNIRGEVNNRGAEVPRGFLTLVAPVRDIEIAEGSSGRLELAQWLASPRHPLTARVMVNRIWQHVFGSGLVQTVDNFGETGSRPTHPELLDHLALRFVEGGWSVKAMVRAMILSRTYRLDSGHDPAAYAVDPGNVFHWRMSPRRLEAEAIRDALLMAGGELDLRRPEGSPVNGMDEREINRTGGPVEEAFDRPVRSVYLPILRDHLPHMLEIFDFAHPSQVTGRRDVTTVSTQALYFMNNPFVAERARAVAAATAGAGASRAGRVSEIYMRVLGREPRDEELDLAQVFLNGGEESAGDPWASFVQALFASAEFRYVQ
ncbi:MAG TPA: PSD1 and planctomycete cytochrome C domain-containing protein [Verrucomicrobiales bacterium]|nr:PSD1 and planctomycete cytochrome C domain-containing protein [Verrucomicrobiales bacterium]